MKLATAAAVIIARALPAESDSSSPLSSSVETVVVKAKKENVHRNPWKNFAVGPLAERRKLKQLGRAQGMVSPLLQGRLVAAEEGYLGEECDPSSSSNVLGVLSCGPGRYCVETSRLVAGEMGGEDGIPAGVTSSLGGFCLKDNSFDPGVMHRKLQEEYCYCDNATSSIGYVNYICYNRTMDSENNPYKISCECNGIDIEAYTGFANCSKTVSFEEGYCIPWLKTICGDNITDICGSTTYTYNFTGPDEFEYTFCFDHADPEGVTSCVTYTFPGFKWENDPTKCLIQVDGINCNSCAIAEYPEYWGIGASNSSCVIYDCSNTAIATKGYSCQSLWFKFAGGNLKGEDELPCEGGCMLCGEGGGYITEGLDVTFPGFEELDCFYAAVFAVSSDYGPLICSNDTFRSELAQQCGCGISDGGGPTVAPTPPVTPPTEEDNGSSGSGASTSAIMTTGLRCLGLAIAVAAVAEATL